MSESFPTMLDKALERLEAGEPIEAILDDYAAYRDELAPCLSAAQEVLLLRNVPLPSEPAPGLQAFLDEAETWRSSMHLQSVVWRRVKGWLVRIRDTRLHRVARYAAGVLLIQLLLLGLFGSTVALASNSLPGDLIYPAKLAGEEIRLVLVRQQAARAEYHLFRATIRAEEIYRLGLAGRPIYEVTVERLNRSLQASLVAAASESIDEPGALLSTIERTAAEEAALLASVEAYLTSDSARRLVRLAYYGLAEAGMLAREGQADVQAFRLNVSLWTLRGREPVETLVETEPDPTQDSELPERGD
jgi:hypothetical protein